MGQRERSEGIEAANERLSEAARRGDLGAIKRALSEGAEVDAGGGVNGWTPLLLAARGGGAAAVEALLLAGADPNLALGDASRSPLIGASESGDTAAARLLIGAGGDLEARDTIAGRTALAAAAERGHAACVEALLLAGANPNAMDNRLQGALSIAVREERGEVVRLLAAAGADADSVSKGRLCAWDWAEDKPEMRDALAQGLAEREAAQLAASVTAATKSERGLRV